MMTLIASALAGGDCIDDADALRAGGTAGVLDCTVKAPSTLGTFLRSFRWGHVRQLDRVSRELLARAWPLGRDPATHHSPSTWTPPSARPTGWPRRALAIMVTPASGGYHPLLAVAAGTGDVLMARLREGRATTARGAAHFLRETVGRVRHAGPRTTHHAGRQRFLHHGVVSVCRKTKVRFSITIRQRASLRNLIEAIPRMPGTPIPYWMEGAADVAETAYTPSEASLCRAGAAHRPAGEARAPGPNWPSSPPTAITASSPTGTGTPWIWRPTSPPRRDRKRHRDLKYGVGLNHLPSGRFAANAAWLAVQVMAHNLARWTARIGLGEQIVTTKTRRRRSSPWPTAHPQGPPPHFASAPALALGSPVQQRTGSIALPAASFLTAPVAPDPSAGLPNRLAYLPQVGS